MYAADTRKRYYVSQDVCKKFGFYVIKRYEMLLRSHFLYTTCFRKTIRYLASYLELNSRLYSKQRQYCN